MPDDELQSAFELTGALTTTSHDGATALAVMSELEKWWATSGIGTLRRAPGQPGGEGPRLCGHPTLRHPGDPAHG
ncbi:DUF6207 family protein [Streptomyces sp. NPDC002668]|uniref:DUF6207 family protein n=1 Tax=Streptomyces sp. NPDC002668 TaxID=3154422 RepID=UPI00331B4189